MDHSVAPILDALTDYRSLDRYGFTPPGHRQGRGADPRTRAAIGEDAFRSDLLMTTSPNVMVYAALDGWRRQMVQHGHDQLDAALTLTGHLRREIEAIPGLHVLREELMGAEASHDLDPLRVVIDVSGLDVSGYDAADWLRDHRRIDMGLSDHRRIEATMSLANDDKTAARLLSALTALAGAAASAVSSYVVIGRRARGGCPAGMSVIRERPPGAIVRAWCPNRSKEDVLWVRVAARRGGTGGGTRGGSGCAGCCRGMAR